MYLVRNTFVAKPGCASKLATLLKGSLASLDMAGARVMTDATGDFNRVIMEHTVETLDEFEKKRQEIMSSQTYREQMAEALTLWVSGSRDILRIV
jgi:hypothetical protein